MICPYCKIVVNSKSNLNSHIKVKHSMQRKCVCEEFGKGFTRHVYYENQKNHLECKKCKTRINLDEKKAENKESNAESAFNNMFKSKKYGI